MLAVDDQPEEQTVLIAGIKVSNYSRQELLQEIERYAKAEHTAIMLSANIHSINLAHKFPWLKELMNRADLIRNDSAGVMLAGRFLGTPVKERMTWADFGWHLAEFCERKRLTLFFLGNKPGMPEKARDNLQRRHPGLNITGVYHGYFGKQNEENEKIIGMINRLAPNILIVGFGMPLQEKWIEDNREKIKAGIIMTGGNCFTFLAGMEKRAPDWMNKNGLEWLYRFLKNPIKKFSRYMIGNPLFLIRITHQKFFKT